MNDQPLTYCPFAGLSTDRTLVRIAPDTVHRCYALQPAGSPDIHYQERFCLALSHTQCPFYKSPQLPTGDRASSYARPRADEGRTHHRRSGLRRWLPVPVWAALGLAACAVAFVLLRGAGTAGVLSLWQQEPTAARTARPTITLAPGVKVASHAALSKTPAPQTEIQPLVPAAQRTLTGTPTPTQSLASRVVITPTAAPLNVMTAAVEALTATAYAPAGTPTLPPTNLMVATIMPPVAVITDTATPADEVTAIIHAAYATAVTVLTGTFTPFPSYAVTATSSPSPTRTLLSPIATPARTPTATTEARSVRQATATLAASITRERAATAPATACTDSRVQITTPSPGAMISGQLEVRGRAVHDAFAAYIVEFAPGALPNAGYEEVLRSQNRVNDGLLGTFVLTALPSGTYTLSLRVLTSNDDAPAPCRVVIQVRNQ